MKKIFMLLTLLLSYSNLSSQESIQLTKNIILIESNVVENYTVPKSIIFNFMGHSEHSKFYSELSSILKNKIRKKLEKSDFVFDLDRNQPLALSSFDDVDIKFNNTAFDAVCIFYMGELEASYPNYSNDPRNRIVNFDFYMIMVEPNTNLVLLKKKFNINSSYVISNENYALSKQIVNQILMNK